MYLKSYKHRLNNIYIGSRGSFIRLINSFITPPTYHELGDDVEMTSGAGAAPINI